MRDKIRSLGVSPGVHVSVLSVVLVAVWPLAILIPAPTVPPEMVTIPPWALAVLMAGAEIWVFKVRIRSEAQHVSMSEMPLVIGLFTLAPWALLLVRLAGAGPVFVLHRRQPLIKTAFNLAQVGA